MSFSIRHLAFAAALAACAFAAPLARAVPISGEVYFSGGLLKTNTGNLATATAITGYTGTRFVTFGTGDYSTVPLGPPPVGTGVTFKAFSFSATSVSPLWKFTVGPITYSFNATSVDVVLQNSRFLNLSGTGIAYITGLTPTTGTWTITSTTSGSRLTFAASTDVPDSGSTVMLLGAGLAGVAFLARRFKRSAA